MEDQGNNQPLSLDSGFTSMDIAGVELHEVYIALQRAGFDKKEALYIIGVTVSSGAMAPYKYDDSEFNDIGDDDGDFDSLT